MFWQKVLTVSILFYKTQLFQLQSKHILSSSMVKSAEIKLCHETALKCLMEYKSCYGIHRFPLLLLYESIEAT